MNAFKIWIATHPDEVDNQEVIFTRPVMEGALIYSTVVEVIPAYAKWVEHICIPIQE